MARFHVQLVDAATRQVREHGRQVDLALCVGRDGDLGAPRFERGLAWGIGLCGVDQHGAGRVEDARGGRRLQPRVDDHAQRLARRVDQPHVEARVVVEHGAYAGQQRAGALAPGVAVGASGFAGDPLALAVLERGAAVERHCRLQPDPGPLPLHAREETDVQLARRIGLRAAVDDDAGRAQACRALAGHQRVRVFDGHHDAGHTGIDQGVAARRRAAVVRAGLQRDDDGGALCAFAMLGRVAQGHHLGVRPAGLLRVATADHAAVGRHDDAADPRVRLGQPDRLLGERQRVAHQGVDVHRMHQGWCWAVITDDGLSGQVSLPLTMRKFCSIRAWSTWS